MYIVREDFNLLNRDSLYIFEHDWNFLCIFHLIIQQLMFKYYCSHKLRGKSQVILNDCP